MRVVEGLRRKRLAILKKRKLDLRSDLNRAELMAQTGKGSAVSGLLEEKDLIEKEIGVLHCARYDLL